MYAQCFYILFLFYTQISVFCLQKNQEKKMCVHWVVENFSRLWKKNNCPPKKKRVVQEECLCCLCLYGILWPKFASDRANVPGGKTGSHSGFGGLLFPKYSLSSRQVETAAADDWFCSCVIYGVFAFWYIYHVSFKQTNLSWSSLFSRSLDLVQYTHFCYTLAL